MYLILPHSNTGFHKLGILFCLHCWSLVWYVSKTWCYLTISTCWTNSRGKDDISWHFISIYYYPVRWQKININFYIYMGFNFWNCLTSWPTMHENIEIRLVETQSNPSPAGLLGCYDYRHVTQHLALIPTYKPELSWEMAHNCPKTA